jgi:molecular chaperone GrpE (heat shock protein)
VLALLPLLENVEKVCRGLDRQPPEAISAKGEALALLPELADQAMEAIELERIGAIGEATSPSRHEVVDTEHHPSRPHGIVLEILRPGWVFRGKVLRRAKVVANSLASRAEAGKE